MSKDYAEALRQLHDTLLATGADYSDILLDAAAHIELLRGYRDEAESAASIAYLAVDRLQFTKEEREALESAIKDDDAATAYLRADVLRNLLKRHK